MTDFSEERKTPEAAEFGIEEVRVLVDEGREQGYLSSDHIADALQDVELSTDQIDGIYNLFADLGIDIIEGDGVLAEVPIDGHSTIPHFLESSIKSPADWQQVLPIWIGEVEAAPFLAVVAQGHGLFALVDDQDRPAECRTRRWE